MNTSKGADENDCRYVVADPLNTYYKLLIIKRPYKSHGCSVCASKHSLWPIKVKQASRGQFVFKVFAIPASL